MRKPNLKKIEFPCPKCGTHAKYIKPSIWKKIIGKKELPLNNFRCTECKNEFLIIF